MFAIMQMQRRAESRASGYVQEDTTRTALSRARSFLPNKLCSERQGQSQKGTNCVERVDTILGMARNLSANALLGREDRAFDPWAHGTLVSLGGGRLGRPLGSRDACVTGRWAT